MLIKLKIQLKIQILKVMETHKVLDVSHLCADLKYYLVKNTAANLKQLQDLVLLRWFHALRAC